MKKLMILSGVALLGLTGAAAAQGPGQEERRTADLTRAEAIQRADAAFARLDVNGDGRFTREEARTLHAQRREQRTTRRFERLDADNNGQISREEFARGARGPGRRGAGPNARGPNAEGGEGGRPHLRHLRRLRAHGMHMRMRMRAAGRMFGEAGFITADQFRTRALARFDRADVNRDGTLTAEERRTRRGQVRRHLGMGPPPGAPGSPPSPEPAR